MAPIICPSSRGDVERVVRSVMGERILAVRYRYQEVDDGAAYESALPDVDTQVAVVTVDFDHGRPLVVTWAIEEDTEGLFITTGQAPATLAAAPEADVSARPGWRGLVGGTVTGGAGAWYDGSGVPALWSLRLDVGDRSAVIALGGAHAREDVVVYEANELVTIFDATTALAYRPQPEDEGAWGSPIAGA